jgi:hypothetical protein
MVGGHQEFLAMQDGRVDRPAEVAAADAVACQIDGRAGQQRGKAAAAKSS